MNENNINQLSFDVVVVGAGPAGSVTAARLAQLGHSVALIERQTLPREHVGESLSPGVWTQLDMLGALDDFQALAKKPCQQVSVCWPGEAPQVRQINGPPGVLLSRSQFDAMLTHFAIKQGVKLIAPARIGAHSYQGGTWQLNVQFAEQSLNVTSRFVVDACGRTPLIEDQKQPMGVKSFCLYGYWEGDNRNLLPTIKAADCCWLWGMPLPNNRYNAMIFVDEAQMGELNSSAAKTRYFELIEQCGFGDLLQLTQCDKVKITSATAYQSLAPIAEHYIKVGEAALAIDPLSSSGVQKAIQTALSGAIAVNTLLTKPDCTTAAIDFYQQSVAASATQHLHWAQDFYATGAKYYSTSFWLARANFTVPGQTPTAPLLAEQAEPAALSAESLLQLCPTTKWVETPCITGDTIELKPGIKHPNMLQPVAFYAGHQLAPLLQALPSNAIKAQQITELWMANTGMKTAVSLLRWLQTQGVLQLIQ